VLVTLVVPNVSWALLPFPDPDTAISEATAPGSIVAATICSFSAWAAEIAVDAA
jgi:hypothetical protein